MPNVDVLDLKNKKVGTVELPDAVFGVEVNEALIYQAVHHYQAGRRAGTHSTKTRGEVSGAGRKLWRQKGTGRARVGSIRSPLWRHGGTVHGPQPRDYSYKLPKKMLIGAMRSALSAQLAAGGLKVVKAFEVDSHKTREFSKVLSALETGATVLLVDDGDNRNLALSSRNLPGVTLVRSRDLHPYHLLRHEQVIFSQAAVEKCGEVLA
ncbi:MAG: 50S ribosomal protein L4 [Bryobacterales bacterium]